MRNRRPQPNSHFFPDGDHGTVSGPSSARGPANERRTSHLDPEDAALCDAYALRLRKEAEGWEVGRAPFWKLRCSSSVLVGLLIWTVIGVVVYSRLDADTAIDNPAALANTSVALLPDGCRGDYCMAEGGTEAFGAVLGAHGGVFAYSNCYAHTCVSLLDYEYPVPLPPGARTSLDSPHATTRLMRTGMKWQCVEYARRYWMLNGRPSPAVFGSVEGAADMWTELSHVTLLDNVTTAPLFKYANGAAAGLGGSAPREGDLIIYPRDEKGSFPYGHVAVIVGVELPSGVRSATPGQRMTGAVYLAEQNWHSNPWPEPYHNYSRSLPLVVTAAAPGSPARYTVVDDYHAIQGWMRYGDP